MAIPYWEYYFNWFNVRILLSIRTSSLRPLYFQIVEEDGNQLIKVDGFVYAFLCDRERP